MEISLVGGAVRDRLLGLPVTERDWVVVGATPEALRARGFVFHAAPGVSLEEDLRRRDLTINAIAEASDGALIDPRGGLRDLELRLLHHVSAAFVEDPLRVLRVARFAARFQTLGFPGGR